MGRGRLVGISLRPRRGPSADLQDDLFELVQFLVGQLREVRLDAGWVDLIAGHLDRGGGPWCLFRLEGCPPGSTQVSTRSQPGPPMRNMRVETNHATRAAATAAAATAAVLYNVES
jgi:hypothetical protein